MFENIRSGVIKSYHCPSLVIIENNTNASGSGIVIWDSEGRAIVENTIITKNSGFSIFPDVDTIHISYNLFFDNAIGFGGSYNYTPPGVKEILTTYINGDSCDTFYNLFGYEPQK